MRDHDKVIDLIAEKLGVSKGDITPEKSLKKDLGADSLDAVEIIMGCEEIFDISIPDEESEKIDTVKDLLDYLSERC